ncbi:MAG: UDP-N-acetylmuramoyl-L-alanine--D-glutamate ligase [Bryobacterales bacterium]|nr:UDP-N-acetylmuramoyl-L-alanine--D-glutamate ligase [Bryobacterales bacterium]
MRVLVVGMERSGVAAAEWLAGQGAQVRATDLRPLSALPAARAVLDSLNIEFVPQTEEAFSGAGLIVTSPGVPVDLPELEAARRRGVEVIGDAELAARSLRGPILGITGSNGKTTVTAMTGHLLERAGVPCQVGGNIGRAPCAMIASSREDQWNVLELSSFQLETVDRLSAKIAVCLNVTPDHLDRHGTFERYAAAKRRLFETQTADGWAVLNADDPVCVAFAASAPGRVRWFSAARRVAEGAWEEGGSFFVHGEAAGSVQDLQLKGRHNIANALAALLAARLAGVATHCLGPGLRTFQPVEHRLEFVRALAGVSYYNDSKATNVDAALKAIAAFDGGLWVILGGKDKGSDFAPLRAPLAAKARAALLVGAAAPNLREQLAGAVPLVDTGTLDAALRHARTHAGPGDTVLLAPACASFDQFENFEHRGRIFKDLVRQLDGEE